MASKTTQATIPVNRIDRDPNQPRKTFDEAKLDELAHSMRELGQLQPITVRYHRSTRRYQIVMGERRWRAAQRAGIKHLHALVLHDVDDQEAFVKGVAENLARADMNPMEEARAFQRLADTGRTNTEIGAACGKTPEYVGWRMDLLRLVPAAQEAVVKGHMTVGLAWEVARLSTDQQHQFLTRWVRGEFVNVSDALATAKALAGQGAQPAMLVVEELSSAEREEIERRRRQVTSKVDRLAAAGAILQDLATMDPQELAQALAGAEGGVAAYRMRVDHVRQMASKAAGNLRKAAAIAAAASPVQLDSTLT